MTQRVSRVRVSICESVCMYNQIKSNQIGFRIENKHNNSEKK